MPKQHPAQTAAGLVRRWEDCLPPHDLPKWAEDAALAMRALLAQPAPSAEEDGGNGWKPLDPDEFLSVRLANVARIVGCPMPKMSHADIAEVAGTILGSIASILGSRAATSQAQLAEMTARKDAAYEERNRVVAALARVFPSGIARTAIEGWSEDWHGCVYIDLPTGQASWHYHDSQAHLFAHLPPYTGTWDGHSTPEKYERLATLAQGGAS